MSRARCLHSHEDGERSHHIAWDRGNVSSGSVARWEGQCWRGVLETPGEIGEAGWTSRCLPRGTVLRV